MDVEEYVTDEDALVSYSNQVCSYVEKIMQVNL